LLTGTLLYPQDDETELIKANTFSLIEFKNFKTQYHFSDACIKLQQKLLNYNLFFLNKKF